MPVFRAGGRNAGHPGNHGGGDRATAHQYVAGACRSERAGAPSRTKRGMEPFRQFFNGGTGWPHRVFLRDSGCICRDAGDGAVFGVVRDDGQSGAYRPRCRARTGRKKGCDAHAAQQDAGHAVRVRSRHDPVLFPSGQCGAFTVARAVGGCDFQGQSGRLYSGDGHSGAVDDGADGFVGRENRGETGIRHGHFAGASGFAGQRAGSRFLA